MADKKKLSEMLRVDHAGEVGARKIYEGQLLILKNKPEAEEIKEMRDQEQKHLDTFDALLNEHKVRPSFFTPLWNSAGYSLGIISALMGKETAMACTIAVEEVIGEHYKSQAAALEKSNPKLSKLLREFADEELEHADIAENHDGKKAPGYKLLRFIIQSGCKGAIKIAEKI